MPLCPFGRRTRRGGRAATASAVVFLVSVLTGCSASVEGSGPSRSSASGQVPEFEGLWAAEFTSAYGRASSAFERSILADGRITDQELAEVRDKFTVCLSAFGFTGLRFEDSGEFQFDAPEGADADTTNDQVKDCSTEAGEATIGSLHSWIRRNPENQDEGTIMAASLVRKGVVDPSYTAADYVDDAPTESFPFVTGKPGPVVFQECSLDPLGLYS